MERRTAPQCVCVAVDQHCPCADMHHLDCWTGGWTLQVHGLYPQRQEQCKGPVLPLPPRNVGLILWHLTGISGSYLCRHSHVKRKHITTINLAWPEHLPSNSDHYKPECSSTNEPIILMSTHTTDRITQTCSTAHNLCYIRMCIA